MLEKSNFIMSKPKDIIVYFAGAIRGDRAMAETMKRIVRFIQGLGVPVLTEHVGADDPQEVFAQKTGIKKEAITVYDIERQDIVWLDTATHVIAEISGASTGTGREIEYARTKGRLGKTPAKILCLYQKDRELSASPMIRGMTPDRYENIIVKSYGEFSDIETLTREFLGF